MKQIPLIHTISDLFIQFSKEVKDKGTLKLYDINIISENVLVPILSIVYDTDLINLNTKQANYPGIDLASDDHITFGGTKKRIAFQITSTNDIGKVIKTLNGYIKGEFYKNFDEIYIYNLVEKQASYQQSSIDKVSKIVDNKFKFDLNINVIDKSDLETKIMTLTPISKIEKISKLLEDQFVYRKKSLLSLEIWETDGKIGYGFSNLLNSIDLTTYNTLISEGISNDAKDLLQILLTKYNTSFAQNYEIETKDKFKNLGFNTYLKAGFTQALNSFQIIKDKIPTISNIESFSLALTDSFTDLNERLDESDFPLVNQPINHPAILFVKTTVLQIFSIAGIDEDLKDLFVKDFNNNIPVVISETFGKENYSNHLSETKEKWIRENEKDLLNYIRDLAKLGFVDGEELEYQETFGTWQDVRQFGINDESFEERRYRRNGLDDSIINFIETEEDKLKPVEELIEEYFSYHKNTKEDYLNNILFLIADFGKGKTSFLHHFASKMARQYLRTQEGLFPVYINLNEYDKFSNSPSLGVISNYLAKRFKIDIKEDYFKKKNYFFLIDSLDECGELTETNIEKVIKDIVEIQNLDNINQRNNRIIVASRLISKGLKEQITKYKPYEIKNIDKKSPKGEVTENYISVYGFKKEQFNRYIEFALKKYLSNIDNDITHFTGISNKIFLNIIKGEKINLYEDLYDKVLTQGELKRPIFSYMIYKLIISNSNFIDFGKVGVYISFLNQLSRDAKHKDDCNHKVSLKDEFVYRNILHASALLWQYKRQSGEQTSLTKADICRTIEEKEIDKDDRKVLNEFKDIESIHFLSHSYLGEKENTLHFQHQSFAEILLAEYYLKVIIKCAIEESTDVEEARIRLSVGLPTDQTIEFFKGLLVLLKECVAEGDVIAGDNVYAKRELLIPLLTSMAINKHNKKLYSTRLNATWLYKHEDEIFSKNKINDKFITDFPIDKKVLKKIEFLCQSIIYSKNIYFLDEPSRHTVLYKGELVSINKGNSYEIDKWFALIAGNIIGTNIEKKQFFNSQINAKNLFNLIKNWNHNIGYFPYWGRDLFMGIKMGENSEPLLYDYLSMTGVNFSHSYLKGLTFENCNLQVSNFSNSTFEYFNIIRSNIDYVKFDNIIIIPDSVEKNDTAQKRMAREGLFCLTFCFIGQGILFPVKLNNVLKGRHTGLANFGVDYCIIENEHSFHDYLSCFEGLFRFIIQSGKSSKFILSAFKFEPVTPDKPLNEKKKVKTTKEQFEEMIYRIEKEEKAKKLLASKTPQAQDANLNTPTI